jgi:probable HAF family extracellular repeat protein
MKFQYPLCVVMLTFCSAAANLVAAAQQSQDPTRKHGYRIVDPGTLGGPNNFLGFEGSRNINNNGTVAAGTDTSASAPPPFCLNDCFVGHATKWRDGILTDLGTIPNGNGGTSWISDTGLIAGLSMNGVIDPVTGQPELEAVLWKNGGAINLGTFGGAQSIAGSVNDRGQVVGCATNTIGDAASVCMGVPQATQSRAFLWQDGEMRDLGTLGGTDANAFIVNQRGQVTGWSFINSAPSANCFYPMTTDPFLWEDGEMTDLGTLGGTCGFPNWLNERGEVVGQSNLEGDQTFHPFLWRERKMRDLGTLGGSFGAAFSISEAGAVVGWSTPLGDQVLHAFLWEHGSMRDLGVIDGKLCSIAYAVNVKRQVVGSSDDDCAGGNPHAFVWDAGVMTDLNNFVPSNSDVQLTFALSINERGEIASLGILPNGDQHAFVLIPCGGEHTYSGRCEVQEQNTTSTPASNSTLVHRIPSLGATSLTATKVDARLRARWGRPSTFSNRPRR